MKNITVTLTSYNMGDVTEADYDAWISYVSARIDERTGLDVTVDASPFGCGSSEDCISGYEDEDDRQIIQDTLYCLWDEFCADGFPDSAA